MAGEPLSVATRQAVARCRGPQPRRRRRSMVPHACFGHLPDRSAKRKHRSGAFFVLAAVMLSLSAERASLHSWYPAECCSGKDCFVATAMMRTVSGEITVWADGHTIHLPRSFPARPSPDSDVHICFEIDETKIPVAKCLFLPGNV